MRGRDAYILCKKERPRSPGTTPGQMRGRMTHIFIEGKKGVSVLQRRVVLDRCPHSVFVLPEDWRSQERAGIPRARRIAWYCWLCREYEAYKFSVEKLLELARANCVEKLPVRKTETAGLNADYDLRDDAEESTEHEDQARNICEPWFYSPGMGQIAKLAGSGLKRVSGSGAHPLRK